MIRLYNSNIYLSDGLPLINDINVINVATNKEENFLSYINSKNNNNDDNNDNQNTLIILGELILILFMLKLASNDCTYYVDGDN